MKKFVFLIVLIFLLSSTVFCFDFAVGSKIGVNIGWMTGEGWEGSINYWDDTRSADTVVMRFGFSGGIFITLGIFEYLAIQQELLFSTIGGRYKYTYSGLDVDGVFSANVLELPIYLKPRFPIGPGRLYLFIGLDIIFIIGDLETREEALGIAAEVKTKPDRSTLFGVAGGLGYEAPVGSGKVLFEMKYAISITEQFIEPFRMHFNVISALIGYGFNL